MSSSASTSTLSQKTAAALMGLMPVAWGLLAVALGQSTAWDLRNYHWYNAYAFLTGRTQSGIDFLPSQAQFFLNPLIDLPYYFLATHLPLKIATFILGLVQGLNFCLLYLIAAHALADMPRKNWIALGAALAGMLGCVGLSEAGTVFYDNVTSLGLLLAVLLLLRRLETVLDAPWKQAAVIALSAGLPAGFVTGLKLTGAPWCLGIAVALLILSRKNPNILRGIAPAFFFGIGCSTGFLLTYGWWGWHLYSLYQSPLFPYFNGLFHSPYVPPLSVKGFVPPHTVVGQLLFPFSFSLHPRLVIEADWRDWRIPVLYVAMFALGAVKLLRPATLRWEAITRPRPAAFILALCAVGYAGWLYSDATYRYLLPLEMLSPLALVICAGLLPIPPNLRWAALALLGLVLVATVQPPDWGRRPGWPAAITEVAGKLPPDDPGLMILMGGVEADAHLLSAFPPHISFVRLDNRAFSPLADWGIVKLIHARVEAHKGKFMLLAPKDDMGASQVALKIFGLRLVAGSCRVLTDRLGAGLPPDYTLKQNGGLVPPYYDLCDVKR